MRAVTVGRGPDAAGPPVPPRASVALWCAALLLATCVGGCRTATQSGIGDGPDTRRIELSAAQSGAVEAGVRQMVGNPGRAEISAVRALTRSGDGGVHVCGHVRYDSAPGPDAGALPFYLELREVGGKPVPERGQVGTDAAKLSKVKFMCRRLQDG